MSTETEQPLENDQVAPATLDEANTAVADLTGLIIRSLRALAKSGEPVQASQIAGKAWWVLQDGWPRDAERINGTMHYLVRLEDETS